MNVIVDSRPAVMALIGSDNGLSRSAGASRLRGWILHALDQSTAADVKIRQEQGQVRRIIDAA
jgi:hypothetical protein